MSPLWDHFTPNTFRLTHNHRSEQADFSEWLLTVGNGISGDDTFINPDKINITHNPKALIHHVFGPTINPVTLSTMRKNVILSPTNKNTEALNEDILKQMEGPDFFAESIDLPITDEDSGMLLPEEFLHTLTPPGMPSHKLNLKVGAVYMLLRNMNVEEGCCNGTRVVILDIQHHYLHCEIIPNDPLPDGVPPYQFFLPRIKTSPSPTYPFTFTRKQYPIRPAFAVTINKSQGGTYDVVGLDLSSPVFSHGQLYVALSRVRNWKSIHVFMSAPPISQMNSLPTVRNVVWSAIFDHAIIDQQNRPLTQRPPIPYNPDNDNEEASAIHLSHHLNQNHPLPVDPLLSPTNIDTIMNIPEPIEEYPDIHEIENPPYYASTRDEDDDQSDEYRASLEAFFGIPDN